MGFRAVVMPNQVYGKHDSRLHFQAEVFFAIRMSSLKKNVVVQVLDC